MDQYERKKHWENIYQTKALTEVSWFEPTPETSLNFIKQFQIPLDANIIDIGGGDSLLVDHLLDLGYQHITVLDISEVALNRAKERLGVRAKAVDWIVADAATYIPTKQYDFWHDRAAFHFLTQEEDITHYLKMIQKSISPNGVIVIGTFSEQGPKKCSGIEIKQYSEHSMSSLMSQYFEKIKCITIEHKTPFDTIQNFIFCSFKSLHIV